MWHNTPCYATRECYYAQGNLIMSQDGTLGGVTGYINEITHFILGMTVDGVGSPSPLPILDSPRENIFVGRKTPPP